MDDQDNKLFIDLPPLERSNKDRGLSPLSMALIILLFVICGLAGFFAGKIYGTNLIPEDDIIGEELLTDTGQGQERKVLTILVMGIDQRYKNEPSRTDTLILACLNLETKRIDLISIPRDSRVNIPDRDLMRRVNYAYAVGGAELTVRTVKEWLEVPVDYYLTTNFLGFEKCIDILGGVSIKVERRMENLEEGIDLYPGLQKLNGYNSLAYCRWRDDNSGDIGRIGRQQNFLSALKEQALNITTLPRIPSLIAELRQYVITDLTPTKLIRLAKEFMPFDSIEMSFHMLPGENDGVHYGASYWIVDESEAREILMNIFNPETDSAEIATASTLEALPDAVDDPDNP